MKKKAFRLILLLFLFIRPTESSEHAKPSTTPELLLNRTDSGKNTDLSECSTNTEDYVTCTDNSRRVAGIKPASASSSSTTQVPGSNPIFYNQIWVFDVFYLEKKIMYLMLLM